MKNQFRGTTAIILATICYSMYGLYSRYIGPGFSPFTQNWLRNLLICILIGIFLLIKRKSWIPIDKKDIKWILFWTISGSVNMVLLFIAFNHIALGTTYFLLYSTIILSGILAGGILMKEKLNIVKLMSIVLSVLGLTFIYTIEINKDELYYLFFPLLAGISIGLWNTLSKKFSSKYSNIQLVWIDNFVTYIVSFIGAIIMKETIPDTDFTKPWIWLVIFALTQIISSSLTIYGFKYLEAQIASILMPIEVVFATIIGFVIFDEKLEGMILFGGLLITVAAILPHLRKTKYKTLNINHTTQN